MIILIQLNLPLFIKIYILIIKGMMNFYLKKRIKDLSKQNEIIFANYPILFFNFYLFKIYFIN